MFYKLSNTANLETIETTFNSTFVYPNLYKKEKIVNGLSETILPIIRTDNQSQIEFAIWGLLPESFKEDWKDLQKLENTLNIPVNAVESRKWSISSIQTNLCIAIVSGFFSTYLFDGEIYPYYVYQGNRKPFGLAAVYSQLPDGFMTCGILTNTFNHNLQRIHNISDNFPITLNAEGFKTWSNKSDKIAPSTFRKIKKPILKAHPISRQFYKNDIVYDDLLKPVNYKKLPVLSLS